MGAGIDNISVGVGGLRTEYFITTPLVGNLQGGSNPAVRGQAEALEGYYLAAVTVSKCGSTIFVRPWAACLCSPLKHLAASSRT